MSSDDVLKMVAKAWGLPLKRLYGLCQLIDDMRWEASDLRRLLGVCHQHGDTAMLLTVCEWLQAESLNPSWRRGLRKLQAHWSKDGTIYFTLPAEAIEDFKQAPRRKAKTILEGRLKTI
jgi:hypothetical protein